MGVALLLSLSIHALLASLAFGGEGFGLPGLHLPWRERRAEVPELRLLIVRSHIADTPPLDAPVATPPQRPTFERPVIGTPASRSSALPAPGGETAVAAASQQPLSDTAPTATAPETPLDASFVSAPEAAPEPEASPEPVVIATEPSEEPQWTVPPVPTPATTPVAALPAASGPLPARDDLPQRTDARAPERSDSPVEPERSAQETQRLAQRQEAERLEMARVEDARLASERQQAELQASQRQAAERREADRQAAERQEVARAEAARLASEREQAELQASQRQAAERREADRQAAERQAADRAEALRLDNERREAAQRAAERQEIERQQLMRQEATHQAAARAEAVRLEAERRQAEQQALIQQEAARLQAAQAHEARREAALRAIGRQLDEEAARREAAARETSPPDSRPSSWSSARRGRLFGRADPNTELVLYAEAWARRIQLNTSLDQVRAVAVQPHTPPVVTVAIRRDGSVESLSFVVSSGLAAVDEAVRHIVHGLTPYPAFPPALALQFDVIEIRRTWSFDMAVRLY